ncbi:MAG: hypothetical protein U0326_27830 [Polyangiales bacterium]
MEPRCLARAAARAEVLEHVRPHHREERQQRSAAGLARGRGLHPRLRSQRVEREGRAGAEHGLGGVEVEGPFEDRAAREGRAIVGREVPPGHVERGAQRAVPRVHGGVRAQHVEAIGQPREQPLDAEHREPRGGEFQRQREAVERQREGRELRGRRRGRGAQRDEQSYGLGARRIVAAREGQRRQVEVARVFEAELAAQRDHHAQRRRRRAPQGDARAQHVGVSVGVVEPEGQPLAGLGGAREQSLDAVGPSARRGRVERVAQLGHEALLIGGAREVAAHHRQRRVAEAHLDEARLAHARRTAHRRRAGPLRQPGAELIELARAADEHADGLHGVAISARA